MYVIEYVASPIGLNSPILHAELAIGCTVDEAIHQAVHRLPALNAKYGAEGYQIFDKHRARSRHRPVVIWRRRLMDRRSLLLPHHLGDVPCNSIDTP